MRRSHQIISYIIIVIGVVHIVAAAQVYSKLNFNALWFVSGGLWGIHLGVINILMALRQSPSKFELGLWLIINFLSLIFIALSVFVMQDGASLAIALVILACFVLSIRMAYLSK